MDEKKQRLVNMDEKKQRLVNMDEKKQRLVNMDEKKQRPRSIQGVASNMDEKKQRLRSIQGVTKRRIYTTTTATTTATTTLPGTCHVHTRRRRRWQGPIIPSPTPSSASPTPFIVVVAVLLVLLASTAASLPSIPNQDQYFYYDTEGNHVQEYVSDQVTANGGNNQGTYIDRPDFLYDENYPNGRLVEFYAHWCPHCKHFKKSYMELSNKLYDLMPETSSSSSSTSTKANKIEVFAVSCVPNKQLCSRQQIRGYPTIMVFPPKSINGTKINHGNLHPMELMRTMGVQEMQKQKQQQEDENTIREDEPKDHQPQQPISAEAIEAHNLQGDATSIANDKSNKEDNPSDEIIVFMRRSKQEVFEDAHLSFNFAMKTAIYNTEGPLPTQRKEALKKFLQILQKTLPIHSSLHHVVYDLIEQFDFICEDDKNLNQVMDKHPPPVTQWSPASRMHGTGYTAGLWQLFHIITVGAVEWNHMSLMDTQRLNVASIADTIRDYIENFFQCDVCRLNFMSEYDACSHDRCNRLLDRKSGTEFKDWIQLPLWLYETHNSVNVRLRKERIELHDETEDQTSETDVMWPPDEECSSCWLSPGRWDETKVYDFLHEIYWYDDDNSIKIGSGRRPVTAYDKLTGTSSSSSSSSSSSLSYGSLLPWPSWISYSALIVIVVIYLFKKSKGPGKDQLHRKKQLNHQCHLRCGGR
mmetsp:Transcript_53603/g.130549  ORF Transcript_53603/g.130549 Transcript_53603/m.130549 type:complete len:696 (+) Transcript_53603:2-2089(+)